MAQPGTTARAQALLAALPRQHRTSTGAVGAPRLPRPGGWLRFESGGLDAEQALKNLETVVTLLQRAQEGLRGIDVLLDDAVTLVSSAWNEGDRSRPPPRELGEMLSARIGQIDEIAHQCRFHGRGLLDGQSGAIGQGRGVEFVRGGANTRSSLSEGYAVRIEALPSRACILGGVNVDEAWLRAEEEIFLAEGERYLRYRIAPGETATSLVTALREQARAAGLDVQIGLTAQRRLLVRHNQYGSQYKFKGCSLRTPLLSKRPGKVEWSRRGRDIQGTLGGEPAFGIGRMLVGYLDNEWTSELAIVWSGGRLEESRGGGRCYVAQNGIRFEDGAGAEQAPVCLALPVLLTRYLGRWMETASGYRCLAEVRCDTWQAVRDALHLLLAVSFDVEDWLERVRGWIKRYQNQALACLRRSGPQRELPALDEGVSAAQAEHMARQLKKLMQAGELAPAR